MSPLEEGSFFFQPINLHFQPTGLRVERRNKLLILILLAVFAYTKGLGQSLLCLPFPGADLIGVKLVLARELGQRQPLQEGLQGNLRLEGAGESAAGSLGHEGIRGCDSGMKSQLEHLSNFWGPPHTGHAFTRSLFVEKLRALRCLARPALVFGSGALGSPNATDPSVVD